VGVCILNFQIIFTKDFHGENSEKGTMANYLDKELILRWGEDCMNVVKNLLSFMLLPVSIPLLLAQEAFNCVKEAFGMGRRSLDGKVVLITGASSGIGESLARLFYEAGCKLILVSRRKHELERVKTNLVRLRTNGTVFVPAVLEMDLGALDTLERKCKMAYDIYGQVDILINNAGMSHRGSVLETNLEVDQRIMNVNYFGSVSITRHFLKSMLENKSGQIVFMSSLQAKIALPFRSAYSASKHALQAFADSLRAEISSSGVGVTVVHPGYVKTNLSLNALTGSGDRHNQMDASTESGYSADYVAEQTFRAVRAARKELFICSIVQRFAVYLRLLCPLTFFYIMAWRARKAA